MTISARIEFQGKTVIYDFTDITELEDSLRVWTKINILETAEIISWENLKGNPRPNLIWSASQNGWVSK